MRTRISTAREDRDQGFTLIELLVVVIIIGILAAIAIPVFLNQRKKGVDASIKSDLKNAATSVETWATDNPSSAVAAQTVTGGNAGTASSALDGFRASPGNTIKLAPVGSPATPGLYTLCGFNSGASTATDGSAGKSYLYDANAGGLQSAYNTNAC